MPVGPFARIIARLTVVVGGAVIRAVIQAYKDAAQRGLHYPQVAKTFRRRMSVDEASKIIEIDVAKATPEELQHRFTRLYEINNPSETFGGSPYLQKKVENARTIIEEDVLRLNRPPSPDTSKLPNSSSSSSSSSNSPPSQSQFSSLSNGYPLSNSFPLTSRYYNPSSVRHVQDQSLACSSRAVVPSSALVSPTVSLASVLLLAPSFWLLKGLVDNRSRHWSTDSLARQRRHAQQPSLVWTTASSTLHC